jgi:hypothetical protein
LLDIGGDRPFGFLQFSRTGRKRTGSNSHGNKLWVNIITAYILFAAKKPVV